MKIFGIFGNEVFLPELAVDEGEKAGKSDRFGNLDPGRDHEGAGIT